MCGNVLTECSDKKCVYDFGLVVRNTKVEALVKRQQVASSAGIREFRRRHQLTTRGRIVRRRTSGSDRTEIARVTVGNGRSGIFCIGIGPRGFCRPRGCSMAVAAIQLNIWLAGRTANRLHMQRMIQFNGARITVSFIRGVEVGMAVFKATNVARVERFAASRFEIGVTFRTSLIAGSENVDAPAVLGVTRCARRTCPFCGLMDRAIVAVEASSVSRLRGKCSRRSKVAGSAILFQHRVRFAHAAAGIDAMIA